MGISLKLNVFSYYRMPQILQKTQKEFPGAENAEFKVKLDQNVFESGAETK